MRKKLLSIILSLALLLPACGSEKSGGTGKEPTTSIQSNPTGSAEVGEKHLAGFTAENTFEAVFLTAERSRVKYSTGVSEALLGFSGKLSAELYESVKEDNENFLYSPLGLYLDMAMLADVCDLENAQDLFEMLGVKDKTELEEQTKNILSAVTSETNNKNEPSICKVSNSLWTDDEFGISDEAKKLLENVSKQMYADMYMRDLQSSEALAEMNEWADRKTNGLIKEIPLEPSEYTRLILLNALYFKKGWKESIYPDVTRKGDFTKADGTKVQVDMMHTSPDMNKIYYKSQNAMSAPLYYNDDSYVIFIKPDEKRDMKDILEKDVPEIIDAYGNNKYSNADRVYFTIPKLQYESSLQTMGDVIKSQGLKSVFDPDSGALETLASGHVAPLYVEGIGQSCKIIMDEKGTEAAAVTEIMAADNCVMEEKVIEMTMDSSFAFIIMSSNNTPLFIGMVGNPA